jgi:hypothetical protein
VQKRPQEPTPEAHFLSDWDRNTPLHVPGAFAALARRFDAAEFGTAFVLTAATQGYGNVWYQEEFLDSVYSCDERSRELPLPLSRAVKAELNQLMGHFKSDTDEHWQMELFWSEDRNATLGPHLDNDEVFTIQLIGTKKWMIDRVDLERLRVYCELGTVIREGPHEAWVPTSPDQPLGFVDPKIIWMEAGDVMCLPAFCLHQVWARDSGLCLSANVSARREKEWQAFLESHQMAHRADRRP